jgi:hypothetical protein
MKKNLVRNLAIFVGLIAIAFLAKMEAINFLLALLVGTIVTIYVFKWQQKVYQKVDESIDKLSSWILTLILGLIMATYRWHVEFTLPLLAGFFSGYLVYSTLNALLNSS